MKKLIIIVALIFLKFNLYSQEPSESRLLYSPVRVSIDSINNSIRFERKDDGGNRYTFYLQELNETGDLFEEIADYDDLDSSNYIINNIEKGKLYEYDYINHSAMVYGDRDDPNSPFNYTLAKSHTYLACGKELEPYTARRTILILVDTTLYPDLEDEINRLRNDLVTEGWGVRINQVNRMEFNYTRVEDVLSLFAFKLDAYINANKNINIEAIFLIGKNPKFYSGRFAPDDRSNHFGAWPADGFFGIRTPFIHTFNNKDYSSKSIWDRNNYGPNEFIFDYNTFPYKVDLMVGSLDLSELSSFKESEVELIRRYLDKDHKYRTGQLPFRRRGLIDDHLADKHLREAPASSAWRNFNSMFGPDSITEGNYFTTLDSQSYMASYACSVGHPFDSLDGIGSSRDFATRPVNTIFTMLYGDYVGDWDSPDNFLRAALASEPSILTSAWVGHPHWFFHHLSIGYPIGYSTRLTQNNQIYNAIEHYINDTTSINYDPYKNGTHTALLGDPTLTMYPLPEDNSVINLTADKVNDYTVRLSWVSPTPNETHYYDIFRSKYEYGPFEKVNKSSTQTPEFTDIYHYTGKVWYMVREKVLEHSPTASFWKHLRGKIVKTEVKTEVEEQIHEGGIELTQTNESVTITANNLSDYDILVYDLQGRHYTLPIIENGRNRKIDISELITGIYYIVLKTDNKVISKSFKIIR